MIFKSLYIQGFKSFADKTLIEFPSGITAIVGPNGSGKSNIMDALRWVFGEQRASELRGNDMGDVIFGGSEKRKPANFAEVGLTMSGLPPEITGKWGTFSDVTVTRKIYRTGEREYYINGRKCRLKDIRDIFFDTGLGARSISIIEQERVTKIVNSTPEELRYFLEETAGVIRYKERRREAETRLKQTQENLARLTDLLGIISSDMDRLSGQVEQVKKYRELKENRTTLEKTFLCMTYAKLLKDKTQLDTWLAECRTTAAEVIGRHQAGIDRELELQTSVENLKEELKVFRQNYESAKEKQAQTESDIRQLESYLDNAEKQKEQLSLDIQTAETRVDEIKVRLERVLDTLEDTAELCADFEEKVEDHTATLSSYKVMVERGQDELKEHNKKYLELTQKFTDITNRLNMKQAQQAGQQATLQRLLAEQTGLKEEKGNIAATLAETSSSLQILESAKNSLTARMEEINRNLTERREELSVQSDSYAALTVNLNTINNQITFLQREIESRMAVSEAGKEIIQTFKGRPYTDLTDTSPEEYLQHSDLMVFEDLYKDEVLKKFSGTDISLRFIFSSGINRIKEEDRLEKIEGYLYRTGHIYRNIGTDDPARVLMELQNRLAEENTKRTRIQEEMGQSGQHLDTLREGIAFEETTLTDTQNKLKSADIEYQSMLNNIRLFEDQLAKVDRNVSVTEKEISLAQREAETAQEEMAQLEDSRKEVGAVLEEANDERAILEDKIDNLNDEIDEAKEELAAASRELARYTERKAALETEKTQLTKDYDTAAHSLSSFRKRLENLTAIQVLEWKNQLEEARLLKDELTKSVLGASDEIMVAENSQQQQEQELTLLRASLTDINNLLRENDRKMAEYTAKLENVTANIIEMSHQMSANYEEDIEEILDIYTSGHMSRQKLQEEITGVDRAIEELGPLNMAAEEEYETKSRQYHEQTAQKHDIEEAVTNLTELIGEIDSNTVQLFEDTFNAVKKNFTEVFTRFFGSGTAELRLTDPDNMLTTGVELTVNPPGKKISNKNLLSGGEKALAALTLLFALFLQKPTPFCFLDEVDAPLDDANAARFIAMVKSLSTETQFIIITHKHLTMASADSLYGVTMQEGGVSTILSVDLKN